MLKPKTPYTRKSTRSEVTPSEVQGSIVDAKGRMSDVVLVWNVSDEGLCLWTTERFKRGEQVDVVISKPDEMKIRCDVRWCRAIPDKSGYLLGVQSGSDSIDALQQLHGLVQRSIKAV